MTAERLSMRTIREVLRLKWEKKFISEHHKYTPEQVMKNRSEGRSFVDIDRDVQSEKQRKGKHQDKDRKEKRSRGKGGK